jgi:uncharacterized protein (TIGR00369 family)
MLALTIDDLYRFLATEFPQVEHLDLRIEELAFNRLRLRVPIADRHLRPGGTVSGPTMMTLADAGLYLLILARIGPVALAVTTSLTINFLRKPRPTDLLAEARLLKLGRQLAVGEVTLHSAGNETDAVAHATLTYSIPPVPK